MYGVLEVHDSTDIVGCNAHDATVLHVRGLQTLHVHILHKCSVHHIEAPRGPTRVRLEVAQVLGGQESVVIVQVTTHLGVECCVGDGAPMHVGHEVDDMRHGRFADGSVLVHLLVLGLRIVVTVRPDTMWTEHIGTYSECEVSQIRSDIIAKSMLPSLVLEVHSWLQVMTVNIFTKHVQQHVNQQVRVICSDAPNM